MILKKKEKNAINRYFVWICDFPVTGFLWRKVENLYCLFLSCFTDRILADS